MMIANTTGNHSSVHDETDYLNDVFVGILGSLAVLTNAPLLIVLQKNNTKIFLSRMSYLVANLAFADLLTGVATIIYILPLANLHRFQWVMIWTTTQASFLTLFLMSVERLVVLSYPLSWPLMLTTKRTIIGIALTWFIAIGCGLAVHFYTSFAQFALVLLFEVSIVAAVVVHTVIFFHLRNRVFFRTFEEIADTTDMNIRQVSQPRATKVLLILVAILMVTVLPYMITLHLVLSDVLGFISLSPQQFNFLVKSLKYLFPIEITNFIANPIVYAWRLKRYRKAFTETFVSFVQNRSGWSF